MPTNVSIKDVTMGPAKTLQVTIEGFNVHLPGGFLDHLIRHLKEKEITWIRKRPATQGNVTLVMLQAPRHRQVVEDLARRDSSVNLRMA